MKTPKRHTGNPRAVDIYAQRHSRWKRKNRIRQLKNTIARMKEENARLWDGFSRMSVSCCDLYNTYIFDHPGETHVHLTPRRAAGSLPRTQAADPLQYNGAARQQRIRNQQISNRIPRTRTMTFPEAIMTSICVISSHLLIFALIYITTKNN
jgi:hypothetical protein